MRKFHFFFLVEEIPPRCLFFRLYETIGTNSADMSLVLTAQWGHQE